MFKKAKSLNIWTLYNYRMTAKKTATIVIMSIIFSIVLVALVNVGMSLFMDSPEYSDYCVDRYAPKLVDDPTMVCPSVCTELWELEDGKCTLNDCGSGCGADGETSFDTKKQCDVVASGKTCYEAYDEAREGFDMLRFYVLAGLGFLLILIGIFVPEPITKFTGMGAGGIMVIEAVILNLDNKVSVFVTLALFLVIGIFATIKLLRKQ